MMETEIVLGRPGSGKTAHAIEKLNEFGEKALLVSLENPAKILIQRGLKSTVAILDVEPNGLNAEDILALCRQHKPALVAIDNLELVPQTIDLASLQRELEFLGVQILLITSHLRRDMQPVNRARLDSIQGTRKML